MDVCVEHSKQPRRGGRRPCGDRARTSRHGRCRTQHQRDATPARERRQSSGDTESSVRLGRRRPHHPRRPCARGLFPCLTITNSPQSSLCSAGETASAIH